MKKYIAFILCLFIILPSLMLSAQASSEICATDFFSQVREMAKTYDNGDGLASNDSGFMYTNRLIVKTETNEPLNNYYGAVNVVEGYDCLHFLQYQNRTQAENAYIKFNFANVKYVEYDFYITLSETTLFNSEDITNEHLSWNSAVSQVDDAFDYILEKNIACHEVRVAVIDSGLYAEHYFFDNSVSQRIIDSNYFYTVTYTSEEDGTDYTVNYSSMEDDFYHGTHVAGTIFDNTLKNVKIVPYRITNESDVLYSDILSAFESILIKNGIIIPEDNSLVNSDAADDIDIVNMSFAGNLSLLDTSGKTLQDKISLAVDNGIIIVAAAGNKSKNADAFFPACHPDVISVSATDENNIPAVFSNFGSSVDIAAPGVNIRSTTPRITEDFNNEVRQAYSAYMTCNGTSYSAPLITAAVATLKSIDFDITFEQAKKIIKETAYVPDGWNINYGTGIVNFYNMVKAVLEPEASCQPVEIKANKGKIEIVAPEGTDARIYYTIDGSVPTIDNHIKYTEPLSFRNNYVKKIIAVCHENGKLIGEPVSYNMINHKDKTIFYKWTKTLPSNEDSGKATWYSRNSEIASVDENGKITGVSPGNTDIICTYPTGERVTWNIKVQYSPVQLFFIICFFGFLWI